MPALDELRRWARGEAVEGLPSTERVKEAEPRPKKPRLGADDGSHGGGYRARQFKANVDGTDALLQFGIFRGESVSNLVTTIRGRKYMRWILANDFDERLKDVCRHQLELAKRAK